MPHGLELLVELVDERDARRDVQLDDLLLADAVEVLHERAQAVAVRGDEHALIVVDRRRDRLVPVRQEARDRVLQRFGERQLAALQVAVPRVVAGISRIVDGQGWRRDVVAAAPDFDLGVAVLGRRLRLVQALERAVVSLVQPPRLVHRDPHQIHVVERDPQRANRALQDRRVGEVEGVAAFLEQPAGLVRLFAPALGQIDVDPAGESVFLVPRAFAMTEENDGVHG